MKPGIFQLITLIPIYIAFIALIVFIFYKLIKKLIKYTLDYKYQIEQKNRNFEKYNIKLDEIAADIENYEKGQSE